MTIRLKLIMLCSMSLALMFGFAHLFHVGPLYTRLHIFLFNLCSGGTLILYFSQNSPFFKRIVQGFFIISFGYALCAFFEAYGLAICCAVVLSLMVEAIRINRFSIFPYQFFLLDHPVSEKFHQASLLCLSIGLLFSGVAIINDHFFHFVELKKLTLDTFFLGFSFPLSLITFSLIFKNMEINPQADNQERLILILKNVCFWLINLGVIIFFIFILMESPVLEVIISSTLLIGILLVLVLHLKISLVGPPKDILLSGLFFLILTACSGIFYILYYFIAPPPYPKIIMKLHTLYSLYGWNLSGLILLCRQNKMPSRIHHQLFITFHWIIIVVFAPLAYYYRFFAIITVIFYSVFIYGIFFTNDTFITEKELNETIRSN